MISALERERGMERNKERKYGAWSQKTIRLSITGGLLCLLGTVGFILGIMLDLKWLYLGACVFIIICSVLTLVLLSKRQREEKRIRAEALTQLPHSIEHPLAQKIFAQYDHDKLADFTQYISFRGWKLRFIEKSDCLINMCFVRKEHEVSITIGDGETSIIIDGGNEPGDQIWIDMDEYSEPIRLWNRITLECRGAVRNR